MITKNTLGRFIVCKTTLSCVVWIVLLSIFPRIAQAGLLERLNNSKAVPVDIYINTSAVTDTDDDDVVRLKSTLPAKRFFIDCRIRIHGITPEEPLAEDVAMVLTNPDGRLRFGSAATATETLVLPKNGDYMPFQISGEQGSQTVGDAVIEAHRGAIDGALSGKKEATVFWFDNASITAIPVENYAFIDNFSLPGSTLTYTAYAPWPGPAVKLVARATLQPTGLNCNVPQVSRLRIGIIQNGLAYNHTTTQTTPEVIGWGDSPQVPPDGGEYPVPASYEDTITISPQKLPALDVHRDTLDSQPLYTNGALVSCAGETKNEGEDSPQTAFFVTNPPIQDEHGLVIVALIYIGVTNAVYNDKFRIWVVCYDTEEAFGEVFRQTDWELNVNSGPATNPNPDQKAEPIPIDGSDIKATDLPKTSGLLLNDMIIDPANQTREPSPNTINITK